VSAHIPAEPRAVRAGMKRCKYGETPCVCPAGGERQRGRGPVRKATTKKEQKKERKKNKQTKAVLFIYFSP